MKKIITIAVLAFAADGSSAPAAKMCVAIWNANTYNSMSINFDDHSFAFGLGCKGPYIDVAKGDPGSVSVTSDIGGPDDMQNTGTGCVTTKVIGVWHCGDALPAYVSEQQMSWPSALPKGGTGIGCWCRMTWPFAGFWNYYYTYGAAARCSTNCGVECGRNNFKIFLQPA